MTDMNFATLPKAAGSEITATTHAQELTALIGFIEPVIQSFVHASSKTDFLFTYYNRFLFIPSVRLVEICQT